MKRTTLALCTAPVLLMLFLSANCGFSQGSLTPPGAPAPTMKSLQQVEPRMDVLTLPGDSTAAYIISAPGSYYLTTNIAGIANRQGIKITASNVTLDLNGFALLGIATAFNGIYVQSGSNVVIYNGAISGWGADGILVTGAAPGGRFEKLQVSGNAFRGLETALGASVADCTAISNRMGGFSSGVQCTFRGCKSLGNMDSGFLVAADSYLMTCTASSNNGDGFSSANACQFQHCLAADNDDGGFRLATNSVLEACQALGNGFVGIYGGKGNVILKCMASDTDQGIGINLGADCRIEDCIVANNSWGGPGLAGIWTSGAASVIRCQVIVNAGWGIRCDGGNSLVSDCVAQDNEFVGIVAGGRILNCVVSGNSAGISAFDDTAVSSCTGTNNFGWGILAANNCRIESNTCNNNGMGGIYGSGSFNRIDSNHLVNNVGWGVQVSTNGYNLVVRNSAAHNKTGSCYNIPAGNTWGPFVLLGGGQITGASVSTGWENFDGYTP